MPPGRRALRRCPFLAALTACLVVLAGCGSYPKAVHTYEYLLNYDRMSEENDPLVSLVYLPDPHAFKHCAGITVGEITMGEGAAAACEDPDRYTMLMRALLVIRLTDCERFDTVGLDTGEPRPPHGERPLYRLEGMITRFNHGSGWRRYWSWFVFASGGATDVQFEGCIRNVDSGELVMEFADRRRFVGHTPWGPDPRTNGGEFAMNMTMQQMAAGFAHFIETAHDGLVVTTATTP